MEGVLRISERRRHLPKIRTFQNWDKFFFGQTDTQTDRQTDRQTDIAVHREATLPKIIVPNKQCIS